MTNATAAASRFTRDTWQEMPEEHSPVLSLSRRGNCWHTAVVERIFNRHKREHLRQKNHETREDAQREICDGIEFISNPQRERDRNGMLSPIDPDHQQKRKLKRVQQTRRQWVLACGLT